MVLPRQPAQVPFSADVRSRTQDHPQTHVCCETDIGPEKYRDFQLHLKNKPSVCLLGIFTIYKEVLLEVQLILKVKYSSLRLMQIPRHISEKENHYFLAFKQ